MGVMLNNDQTLFDTPEPVLPVLPYGGTSGWSGSEASRERAVTADTTGKTTARQQQVFAMLDDIGTHGLTWKDLSRKTGWHHGTASGALSVLHKAGMICRLTERRDRCHIYVAPQHVNGRETEAHTPNAATRLLVSILDEIEHDLANGRADLALQRVRITQGLMS